MHRFNAGKNTVHSLPQHHEIVQFEAQPLPGFSFLIGGEPLCREDFRNIVGYPSSKGTRTTIGSNSTLIDGAIAKKMLDAGVKCIAISADGVDFQTRDFFRVSVARLNRLSKAYCSSHAELPA